MLWEQVGEGAALLQRPQPHSFLGFIICPPRFPHWGGRETGWNWAAHAWFGMLPFALWVGLGGPFGPRSKPRTAGRGVQSVRGDPASLCHSTEPGRPKEKDRCRCWTGVGLASHSHVRTPGPDFGAPRCWGTGGHSGQEEGFTGEILGRSWRGTWQNTSQGCDAAAAEAKAILSPIVSKLGCVIVLFCSTWIRRCSEHRISFWTLHF